MKRLDFIKSLPLLGVVKLPSKSQEDQILEFIEDQGFTKTSSDSGYSRFARYTGKIIDKDSKFKHYDYFISYNIYDKGLYISSGHGLWSSIKFNGKVTTLDEIKILFKMCVDGH